MQELAKILTGWTVDGLQNGGPTIGFAFLDSLHEPGARTVLGGRYADADAAQGEHAIRDLCRHPSTAQFVATKLVAHVVADDTPAAVVEPISRASSAPRAATCARSLRR